MLFLNFDALELKDIEFPIKNVKFLYTTDIIMTSVSFRAKTHKTEKKKGHQFQKSGDENV